MEKGSVISQELLLFLDPFFSKDNLDRCPYLLKYSHDFFLCRIQKVESQNFLDPVLAKPEF